MHIRNDAAAAAGGQEILRLNGRFAFATPGSGAKIVFTHLTAQEEAAAIRGYAFGTFKTGLAFDTGWDGPTTKME